MTRWRKTKKRADNPCCLMAHGLSALRLCVWLKLLEFLEYIESAHTLCADKTPTRTKIPSCTSVMRLADLQAFSRCFTASAYSGTSPALSSTPPTMSLSQCTPESSRPTTMKTVNATRMPRIARRTASPRMRVFNCIMAVGRMHNASMVVEERYGEKLCDRFQRIDAWIPPPGFLF